MTERYIEGLKRPPIVSRRRHGASRRSRPMNATADFLEALSANNHHRRGIVQKSSARALSRIGCPRPRGRYWRSFVYERAAPVRPRLRRRRTAYGAYRGQRFADRPFVLSVTSTELPYGPWKRALVGRSVRRTSTPGNGEVDGYAFATRRRRPSCSGPWIDVPAHAGVVWAARRQKQHNEQIERHKGLMNDQPARRGCLPSRCRCEGPDHAGDCDAENDESSWTSTPGV